MAEQVQSVPAILRRKQVEARIGLKRSTLYSKIAAGEFPAPIRLGARAVGWIESEVISWLNGRITESRRDPVKRRIAPGANGADV